ncbi:MAG: DegT/DnrJ/EryC1/StrS family aminotransferase [Acidimicrobiia bacterium]
MTITMPSPIPVMIPWIGDEEANAAADAVRSGWIAQGPRVAAFESAFAAYVGAQEAVAVSSCTTGLHLALKILGIARGDEVVVPSFSFVATANAVTYAEATPVFADVDPITGNVTASTIAAALTPATRAVIAVHQAGVPLDLDEVHSLCDPLGIPVIEDAACAIGTLYQQHRVGGGNSLAVFSFHPRKLLTTGEGGMITTSNSEWATRLRRLREHGMSMSAADRHAAGAVAPESYLEIGFNYRMTDVQAAIGMVQLAKIEELLRHRRTQAERYRDAFRDLDWLRSVDDPPHGRTNFQSFWVELDPHLDVTRDEVLERLRAQAISPRRGIMAAHLEPAYAGVSHVPLPNTERLTRHTLVLPLYHTLTAGQQDRVITALVEAAQ